MAALSTLALLSLSAAKTVGNYADSRRAATATEAQGEFEALQLERNAGYADAQGQDALARGRQAEGAQRRGMRGLAGSQRAALAASGVNIDSGSAADVVENDQQIGELDALTIRNNARREAWGYGVQSSDLRQQAGMVRAGAGNTAAALRRQGISTLLSGAGELANIYSSMPKQVSRGASVPATAYGTNDWSTNYAGRMTPRNPAGWNG